ncbi:hypothetical protein L0668_19325 [Paraglaciecola aquimarina]|uniref:ExoP galactose-binding-like domain-containing protein n=1 Tax=Paraglaciecola algarum TaxID=3050085 RepID=A0ABS9DBC6_9ALTE|nr:putative glycoside hydrolase [Paraglaciecola sp. G1-23]MCF2950268.1 hypothetical protein [Paraglaciecola sp. G1-23]
MAMPLVIFANPLDHNSNYFVQGKGVGPWELSLQFGQVKLDNNSGKTVKGSLTASPTKKVKDNDSVSLTWRPRGVENEWGSADLNVLTMNIINTKGLVDISSVKDLAALTFDIKVNRKPKELVELMMESNWDWQTRSKFPLKNVLSRLPKKKWTTVPIPLKCFENDKLDFSKISTIFMLQTSGRMEIELGDIRLTGFPADKVKCP